MRKNRLIFDEKNEEANTFVFTRIDNKKSVKVTYRPEKIPSDEDMATLLKPMRLPRGRFEQMVKTGDINLSSR